MTTRRPPTIDTTTAPIREDAGAFVVDEQSPASLTASGALQLYSQPIR